MPILACIVWKRQRSYNRVIYQQKGQGNLKMEHSVKKIPQRRYSYIGGFTLLAFNLLTLLIGGKVLGLAWTESQAEGENWGMVVVFVLGGAVLLVQLITLLPLAVISMVRKRSPLFLRLAVCLTLILAIAVNGGALGCLLNWGWEHQETFKSDSQFYASGLHQAITSNNEEEATEILESNRELVYGEDLYGNSPLILAVKQKHLSMVTLLLSTEPSLAKSEEDWAGMTALHWAVKKDNNEIAKILIEHGARINQGDDSGKTPLALAREIGSATMIQLLKSHGATKYDFESMIIDAVEQGDYEAVERLLTQGIDVNTRVPNGTCLIHFAAEYGHVDIATLLLEKGANVNDVAPRSELTPLHEAASEGHLDMVKFLLSKGANPKLRHYTGTTPAAMAEKHGHHDIAAYLNSLSAPEQ
jgi:ankyrin repeat protein